VALSNPVARKLTQTRFCEYRVQREMVDKRSRGTINNEQAYLGAVYGKLANLKNWPHENPLKGLTKLVKPESEIRFLDLDEMEILLDEIACGNNPDTSLVAEICLSTGTRWGEAERLRPVDVRKFFIRVTNTQDGETTKTKKNRTIHIKESLYDKIQARIKKNDTINLNNRIFLPCYSAFGHALKRSRIYVPKGQSSHILRHSFATHYLNGGGDIKNLQTLLGHAKITTTELYLHASKKRLEDVQILNPIAMLEQQVAKKSIYKDEGKK